MFEPTHILTLARTAHALEQGEGAGHTIYAIDTPKRRYVVGGLTTRLYPVGEGVARLREDMRAMAGSYNGIVAHTMGCWEDDGTVYVDLGEMYYSRGIAMAVAAERGELAIFDREARECIQVAGFYGIMPVHAGSPGAVTCGECGLSWGDDITPAGRCPWEDSH